ncbi:S24 family peptidase [Paracoccus amoyensis]|nr:S24 family peptidase [Paracoccus amoyensis]
MHVDGRDRKAFAEDLGINAETLGGYERGDSLPDQWFLLDYKKRFSVNLDWLLTGEGEMFHPAYGRPHTLPMGASPAMIRLPIYGDVHAAAGLSSIPVGELADGVMSFDPRFLRDQGAVPEKCSVIWAHGDSMMPTIPDGSALIVDRSQTEVKNGSIMVIGVGDDLLVKRVRRRLDGLIDLISDNSAYAPETLGPASLQQLRVVGRVVYFCRTP